METDLRSGTGTITETDTEAETETGWSNWSWLSWKIGLHNAMQLNAENILIMLKPINSNISENKLHVQLI